MRKQDIKLMRQMKREEEKVKSVSKPNESVVEVVADDAVSFDMWWIEVAKRFNLVHHIKEIMWADFKGRGLKKIESAARYDEALVMFGYK